MPRFPQPRWASGLATEFSRLRGVPLLLFGADTELMLMADLLDPAIAPGVPVASCITPWIRRPSWPGNCRTFSCVASLSQRGLTLDCPTPHLGRVVQSTGLRSAQERSQLFGTEISFGQPGARFPYMQKS